MKMKIYWDVSTFECTFDSLGVIQNLIFNVTNFMFEHFMFPVEKHFKEDTNV